MNDKEYISLKDAMLAITEFCYGKCYNGRVHVECPFSECIANGIIGIKFDKIPDLKVRIK